MANLEKKIAQHQVILIDYLESLARSRNELPTATLEYQVIADTKRNHFQLTRLGWHERKYSFLVLMHLDIKGDAKVWLQLNNTEILVGEELEKRGIPKAEIVIGFKPEYMRPHTGYAAA
jgi:hypothetical protein